MKASFILANTAAPSTTSIGPGAAPAAPAAAPQATETIQQQPPVPGAAQQTPQQLPFWQNPLILMILVFGVMIFFTFRSQKKQQQKRVQMLDAIIKGDRVMLNTGMFGTVTEVRDKSYLVEIADKVQVEVVKNGVAEKIAPGAQAEQK